MSKDKVTQIIEAKVTQDGMVETDVKGGKLFRVSSPMRCAPMVYEPAVIATLSGAKEAILDGQRHVYDNSQYMCCSMSMPVEAGTPTASPENPLLGVYISLDTKVMTELSLAMERSMGTFHKSQGSSLPPGFALSHWDYSFTDALLRLLESADAPAESAILGKGRLRELYYSVLNG